MRRRIFERNILFLSADNACLSRIAEAAAKQLNPPGVRVFSANVNAVPIPRAVRAVIAETGMSVCERTANSVADVPLNQIDLVVSFGDADRQCPAMPLKARVEHWQPITVEPGHSAVETFRAIRNDIESKVFALFMDYWRNVA